MPLQLLSRTTADTRSRQEAELAAKRSEEKSLLARAKVDLMKLAGNHETQLASSREETMSRIEQFGKSNGFAAIFNVGKITDLNNYLSFQDPVIDITADIIKKYHADMASSQTSNNR